MHATARMLSYFAGYEPNKEELDKALALIKLLQAQVAQHQQLLAFSEKVMLAHIQTLKEFDAQGVELRETCRERILLLEKTIEAHQAKIERLEGQRDAALLDLKRLEARLQQRTVAEDDRQMELEKAREEIKRLSENQAKTEAANQALAAKVSAAEQETQVRQARLQQLQDDNAAKDQHIQRLQQQTNTLETHLSDLQSRTDAKIDAMLQQCQRQMMLALQGPIDSFPPGTPFKPTQKP